MLPDEYQELAARTICPQRIVIDRLLMAPGNVQLMHGAIGLAMEAGELLTGLQRAFWYGKPLDQANVLEELGDATWYLAEACSAVGLSLEQVLHANIDKLRKRFPDKFTEKLAAEENRDRAAERVVLEKGLKTGAELVAELTAKGITKEHIDSLKKEAEKLVQNSHGFAEAAEIEADTPITVGAQRSWKSQWASIEEYRTYMAGCGVRIANSYDRMCSVCHTVAIHSTNSTGRCPDCASDDRQPQRSV